MWAWDEAKRQANLSKHGVDFAEVERLDWAGARIGPDARREYGEVRLRILARIGVRLHVLICAPRGGMLRVISLRKANRREVLEWLG
jgi:uncharacterized DUF497 family protein